MYGEEEKKERRRWKRKKRKRKIRRGALGRFDVTEYCVEEGGGRREGDRKGSLQLAGLAALRLGLGWC